MTKKTGMPKVKATVPPPPTVTFEEYVVQRLNWAEKKNQRLENEFRALKEKNSYFMWLSLAYCAVTFLVVVAVVSGWF